jgi:hypothetical protein
MNRDPFALLEIPQRPYLDLELLESTLRRLSALHHPDQKTGNTHSFQQLQEAAAVLRSPASRLRLLANSSEKIPFPSAAGELFLLMAAGLEKSQAILARYHKTSGALSKALLMPALLEAHSHLIKAEEALQSWKKNLDQELHTLDASWPKVDKRELLSLANSFTFADRWHQQLREALLQQQSSCQFLVVSCQ